MTLPVPLMCHKEMTSTLCQTPPAHIQLIMTVHCMRQYIMSQSNLHSSQMPVETPSDCEDLHPYAPIYTVPMNLPVSKHLLLKVYGSNIREIRELGKGLFGKVILAETVDLSAKDLRLSESDDDKSKSILVAVKKLKSDASTATKDSL